jgi:hypothetical protein
MSDHGPYSDLKSSLRFDMGLNDKPVLANGLSSASVKTQPSRFIACDGD